VVTIKMKNGKEYSHGVLRARGHADVPLSWDELLEKYRDCARVALNDQQVARTIEIMGNLEKIGNVREIASILTGMA
jgi:2-methylcitrate dehydratase PrpD